MILVVKPQTPEDALHHLIKDIEATGLHTHLSVARSHDHRSDR